MVKLIALLVFLNANPSFAAPLTRTSPVRVFNESAKYKLTLIDKRQKPQLQLSPANVTVVKEAKQTTISFNIKKDAGVQIPTGPVRLTFNTADVKMNRQFDITADSSAYASLFIQTSKDFSLGPSFVVGNTLCNDRECDFKVTGALLPSATVKIYPSPAKGVYFVHFEMGDKSQTLDYRLSRVRGQQQH